MANITESGIAASGPGRYKSLPKYGWPAVARKPSNLLSAGVPMWSPESSVMRLSGSLYQRSRDITAAERFDLPDDWDEWFGGISLIYVDESDSKARSGVREHLKQYQHALSIFDTPNVTLTPGYRAVAGLKSFLEQSQTGPPDVSELSMEEGIENGIFLFGSPESVVEQLKRKKESNVNAVMSFMRFGAMPEAKSILQHRVVC